MIAYYVLRREKKLINHLIASFFGLTEDRIMADQKELSSHPEMILVTAIV